MLRDADSLANFEWCDEYFEREGLENISQIIKRMYLRMAENNRHLISQIKFRHREINEIVNTLDV